MKRTGNKVQGYKRYLISTNEGVFFSNVSAPTVSYIMYPTPRRWPGLGSVSVPSSGCNVQRTSRTSWVSNRSAMTTITLAPPTLELCGSLTNVQCPFVDCCRSYLFACVQVFKGVDTTLVFWSRRNRPAHYITLTSTVSGCQFKQDFSKDLYVLSKFTWALASMYKFTGTTLAIQKVASPTRSEKPTPEQEVTAIKVTWSASHITTDKSTLARLHFRLQMPVKETTSLDFSPYPYAKLLP